MYKHVSEDGKVIPQGKKHLDKDTRQSTHSSITMGPGLISSISMKAKHFVLVNLFLGL